MKKRNRESENEFVRLVISKVCKDRAECDAWRTWCQRLSFERCLRCHYPLATELPGICRHCTTPLACREWMVLNHMHERQYRWFRCYCCGDRFCSQCIAHCETCHIHECPKCFTSHLIHEPVTSDSEMESLESIYSEGSSSSSSDNDA